MRALGVKGALLWDRASIPKGPAPREITPKWNHPPRSQIPQAACLSLGGDRPGGQGWRRAGAGLAPPLEPPLCALTPPYLFQPFVGASSLSSCTGRAGAAGVGGLSPPHGLPLSQDQAVLATGRR